MLQDAKSPIASKINLAGTAVVLTSLLPQFSDTIAGFFPPEYAALVTGGLGFLVIVLRTFLPTRQLTTQPDR